MYKYYVRKRVWLNPISSMNSGALNYMVARDIYKNDEEENSWAGIDATFTIWDCNRKVSLDFNIYSVDEAKEISTKINKLVESLEEFRTALGKAWEEKYNA